MTSAVKSCCPLVTGGAEAYEHRASPADDLNREVGKLVFQSGPDRGARSLHQRQSILTLRSVAFRVGGRQDDPEVDIGQGGCSRRRAPRCR